MVSKIMRNWWYDSSTKQKWFVGGLLLTLVNVVVFVFGYVVLKLLIFNGIAFIWAWLLPSDYDEI